MSSDSDIRTDHAGEHLWVVSAPGERDLADVDQLEAAFDAVFEHGSTLVVDLSETTFIDSAVIGLLVSTQRRVEDNAAHRLAVVAPRGQSSPPALGHDGQKRLSGRRRSPVRARGRPGARLDHTEDNDGAVVLERFRPAVAHSLQEGHRRGSGRR